MVTAAVIGCGDISALHFEALALLPDATLAAVSDVDEARLARSSTALGVPGFSDYRELLDSVRPDVVHVCTPHNTHASIALECLERGIHVVLEKPLAHTLADGERLVAAAERSTAKIAVCFQNRYNPPVVALRSLLDAGRLGAVTGAHATVVWHREAAYYLDRPWRGRWDGSGGGLLMNQAIHTLDLLQWLVGEVDSVVGGVSTRTLAQTIEVEDTADMVLEHRNGVRSVFFATLSNAINSTVTVDIATTGATLSLRGDLTVTHADGVVETVEQPVVSSAGRGYWGVSHQLLIADFYGRLADDEPFWIGPAEALESLRIIKDVYAQSVPPVAWV